MFDQSLCDSDCPEELNCMRHLIEEKYCYNAVKIHLGNHLCNHKNNYCLKIDSSCEMPILRGGGRDGIS